MPDPATRRSILALLETLAAFAAAISLTFIGTAVYLAPTLFAEFDEAAVRERLPQLLWIQSAVFVAVAWVMMRRRQVFPTGRSATGFAVVGFAVAAALAAFAGSWLISVAQARLGWEVVEQQWVVDMMADPSALRRLLPVVLLAGPVAEEMFFRGFVFRYLHRQIAPWAGYAVSAALFALVHFNPSGVFVYAWIGTCLAVAYRRSGSLLTPALGHVVFNGLVLLAMLYGEPFA